jgi:hypothetical protein
MLMLDAVLQLDDGRVRVQDDGAPHDGRPVPALVDGHPQAAALGGRGASPPRLGSRPGIREGSDGAAGAALLTRLSGP